MGTPRHGWGPALTIVAGFLPIMLGLAGWALTNSNRAAVTESAVAELKQAHEDDEKRIEKLEIQVAAQSCRKEKP